MERRWWVDYSLKSHTLPEFTTCLKNLCNFKRPGIVIFKVFGHSLFPILNLIEDKEATL
ncbi:MAG: hypothetical protein QME61_01695 [Patescibacteria group bacterium]|nr:hypothetical protein [Patescibacteria group bacterium]